MNPALGASICLLGLVYPFAVYIGVERWPSAWLPAAMALLWLARALLLPANRPGGRWLPSLAVAGCLALAAVDSPAALRAYPVMMNALLLAVFGISLLRGQTVIERLARLRHADLPAAGVRYTRRITQAWCAFFLLNGPAAAILAAWGTLASLGLVQRRDQLRPDGRAAGGRMADPSARRSAHTVRAPMKAPAGSTRPICCHAANLGAQSRSRPRSTTRCWSTAPWNWQADSRLKESAAPPSGSKTQPSSPSRSMPAGAPTSRPAPLSKSCPPSANRSTPMWTCG